MFKIICLSYDLNIIYIICSVLKYIHICTYTYMGSYIVTKHFNLMILKTLLTLLKGTFQFFSWDKSKRYEILMKIEEIIKQKCSFH